MATAAERAAAKKDKEDRDAAAAEQAAAERAAALSSVVNIAGHAVDLDDGATLAPGETAQAVIVGSAHNTALVRDGHLAVTNGPVPEDEESN